MTPRHAHRIDVAVLTVKAILVWLVAAVLIVAGVNAQAHDTAAHTHPRPTLTEGSDR